MCQNWARSTQAFRQNTSLWQTNRQRTIAYIRDMHSASRDKNYKSWVTPRRCKTGRMSTHLEFWTLGLFYANVNILSPIRENLAYTTVPVLFHATFHLDRCIERPCGARNRMFDRISNFRASLYRYHTCMHTFTMHLLLDKNIGALRISHAAAKLKLAKTVTSYTREQLLNKIPTGCWKPVEKKFSTVFKISIIRDGA